MQPHEVSLEDGQGLGVDGLSMVGPACQDVPPPPVGLSQGDTHGVWQEEQGQEETSHVESGGSPELVPESTIYYQHNAQKCALSVPCNLSATTIVCKPTSSYNKRDEQGQGPGK